MELLLNINQYNYKEFLLSKVDILIIALEYFSCGYSKTYSLEELPLIIKEIHNNNKKVYLSLNILANEELITLLNNNMSIIKALECDAFVIADFGILQLFKENNLFNKVVFNPVTAITNKYSCSIYNNMGLHHTCIANELNLKDILSIAQYTQGNIEILAQGYYQICNSKRPLLTNFFKSFKINHNSPYYYIQEENRDYAYPIIEVNNELLVYIDKQRCILPYLKQILDANIKYLKIDTVFLSTNEIHLILKIYNQAIDNTSLIDKLIIELEKNTNSNTKCLENISILRKGAK